MKRFGCTKYCRFKKSLTSLYRTLYRLRMLMVVKKRVGLFLGLGKMGGYFNKLQAEESVVPRKDSGKVIFARQ